MWCTMSRRFRDWTQLGYGDYKCTRGLTCSFGKWLVIDFPLGLFWGTGGAVDPLCPCYEMESIDHALSYCPWVGRIWRLVGLLHGISSSESSTQVFLDKLRCNLDSKIARLSRICAAYVTYYIWLSWNSWMFDSRSFACFVLERTLMQVDEIIYLELIDMRGLRVSGTPDWLL